jgi:hypothetical protein
MTDEVGLLPKFDHFYPKLQYKVLIIKTLLQRLESSSQLSSDSKTENGR